jgi:haloacetate dehalogenase
LTSNIFEGFEERRIATKGAKIFVLTGGSGSPLLLLHGYPQNHVMWHGVAPILRRHFSLVIPDLRGYGNSQGPRPDSDHLNYSKRVMALDMVELMSALGHERFAVAGHDRGGRVAYRLALDHPDRVVALAVLDIVPTVVVWERMDYSSALGSFHWPFLAQPAPLPERLIGHDPEFFLRQLVNRWAAEREAIDPAALDEYVRHFKKPSVIEATCEDYRAGATVDLEHDRADRERGRKIHCSALVVWSRRYLAAKAASPLEVWRSWAGDVRELPLDCGHFVAEERTDECAAALLDFFKSVTPIQPSD